MMKVANKQELTKNQSSSTPRRFGILSILTFRYFPPAETSISPFVRIISPVPSVRLPSLVTHHPIFNFCSSGIGLRYLVFDFVVMPHICSLFFNIFFIERIYQTYIPEEVLVYKLQLFVPYYCN